MTNLAGSTLSYFIAISISFIGLNTMESCFSRFKAGLLQDGGFDRIKNALQKYLNTLKCIIKRFAFIHHWAIKPVTI